MSAPASLLVPYLNRRDDKPMVFLGLPTAIRSTGESTGGAFGLVEHWEMPVGFATPYHTHRNEDEGFYVLNGEAAFLCNGKWLHATAGTYVFGPKNIAHGFKIIGDRPASMLIMCSPAGFERFVMELSGSPSDAPSPPDMAKVAAVAATFSIDFHGPLPEPPAFES